MSTHDKPLVWLHGEVKSPPFSHDGRRKAGLLLRLLQRGHIIAMPHSRPMPRVGPRCHELRINDHDRPWRIVYRIDRDAIVILDVFEKKTPKTPQRMIDVCRERMKGFDSAVH
jgi:phage-related protein